MARELADVLHHFLGDDAPAPRLEAPCLALLADPDDALALGVAWNLAYELVRLEHGVVWITSPDDEALLPAESTPELTRLLAPALGLRDLALAAREAAAKLAGARMPGLVLVRVPPRWVGGSGAAEPILGWTLQLVGGDATAREHALRLAARVRARRPGARVGVTLREVRSVAEAAGAFDALAEAQLERGEEPLVSYGLLFDETEIYRALLAREPLASTRADTRAARALADLASLVSSDLVGDAG